MERGGNKTAEYGFLGSILIRVKWLWIEFLGESNDVVSRYDNVSTIEVLTISHIFKISSRHVCLVLFLYA
jgi:hypothetical protein